MGKKGGRGESIERDKKARARERGAGEQPLL